MRLNHLHAAAMAPGPSHAKPREDRTDARNHQRVRRSDSVDSSHSKPPVPENRISTIPELTESFERRLLLRDDGATSPVSGGVEARLLLPHPSRPVSRPRFSLPNRPTETSCA